MPAALVLGLLVEWRADPYNISACCGVSLPGIHGASSGAMSATSPAIENLKPRDIHIHERELGSGVGDSRGLYSGGRRSAEFSSYGTKAPSGAQWVHEIKLDGYRMAARIEDGRVKL